MAWTSPMTAVANSAFTAAQFNAHVRDNLLQTAPAIASQSGSYFVGTGVNAIVERIAQQAEVLAEQSTTSTSYTDLATPGPSVTVTTGARALVVVTSYMYGNTTGMTTSASCAVSGATTTSPDDANALSFENAGNDQIINASSVLLYTLTPGTNTFKMQYRVSTGTGNFGRRRLIVMPF